MEIYFGFNLFPMVNDRDNSTYCRIPIKDSLYWSHNAETPLSLLFEVNFNIPTVKREKLAWKWWQYVVFSPSFANRASLAVNPKRLLFWTNKANRLLLHMFVNLLSTQRRKGKKNKNKRMVRGEGELWGFVFTLKHSFWSQHTGKFERRPLQYALLPSWMKQNVFALSLAQPAALNGYFFLSLFSPPHQNMFYCSEVQMEGRT